MNEKTTVSFSSQKQTQFQKPQLSDGYPATSAHFNRDGKAGTMIAGPNFSLSLSCQSNMGKPSETIDTVIRCALGATSCFAPKIGSGKQIPSLEETWSQIRNSEKKKAAEVSTAATAIDDVSSLTAINMPQENAEVQLEASSAEKWMREDLAGSGISMEAAKAMDWTIETPGANALSLERHAYRIPFKDPETGAPVMDNGAPFYRLKLRTSPSTAMKYLSPAKSGIHTFRLPEAWRHFKSNPDVELLLTEGEKKAVAAGLKGLHFLGLAGIWMWMERKGSMELNHELRPLLGKGRKVVMVYDSDAAEPSKKRAFSLCSQRLANALAKLECELYEVVLPQLGEKGKTGVDDFLLEKSPDELRRVIKEGKRLVEAEKRAVIRLPGKGRELRPFIEDVAKGLEASGKFFVWGDEVCSLDLSGGIMRTVPLTPISARSELETYCQFVVCDKKGETQLPSPIGESDAKALLHAPLFKAALPRLRQTVDAICPTWEHGEEWRKIKMTEPGYEKANEIWTSEAAPAMKDIGSVEEALEILCEPLSDFCFEEPSGFQEQNLNMMIAYLLTCYCRLLIEPERSPVFLFDGNRPGVGKDLALGLGPLVLTGRDPDFMPPFNGAEETRKRIFSVCREGRPYMLVSNQKGHLSDSALEGAATSRFYEDRLLGVSEMRSYPNTAIYGISGNNLTTSEDMARRCAKISLRYDGEHIEDRDFRHPNLYECVVSMRGSILSAMRKLVLAWADAGFPKSETLKPSFERWSQIIGGIMEACGLKNPIGACKANTVPNDELEHFGLLLAKWHETHGQTPLKPREIRALAIGEELFGWMGNLLSDTGAQSRFGLMIGRLAGRKFDGLKALKSDDRKRICYTCVKA